MIRTETFKETEAAIKKTKAYGRRPTQRQEKAFNTMVENVGIKGKTKSMGTIMKEAGYSDAMSVNPAKLTGSLGWKLLLAQIDDDILLARIYEIALGTDKRVGLAALQELLKLKGYHLEKETKAVDMFKDL